MNTTALQSAFTEELGGENATAPVEKLFRSSASALRDHCDVLSPPMALRCSPPSVPDMSHQVPASIVDVLKPEAKIDSVAVYHGQVDSGGVSQAVVHITMSP